MGLDLVLDAGDEAVGLGLAKDLGRDGALLQNGERVLVGGLELAVARCTDDEVGLELVRRVPNCSQVPALGTLLFGYGRDILPRSAPFEPGVGRVAIAEPPVGHGQEEEVVRIAAGPLGA